MEVLFTPEQEAQLAQIASKSGTEAERLVVSLIGSYLGEKARCAQSLMRNSLDSLTRSLPVVAAQWQFDFAHPAFRAATAGSDLRKR